MNAVGLRRAGFSAAQRSEIKEAFALLYRRGLNVAQAVAEAGTRPWTEPGAMFWNFVAAAKKRGLCDYLPARHTRKTRAAPAGGDDG